MTTAASLTPNKISTTFILFTILIGSCLFANLGHAQVIKSFVLIDADTGGLAQAGVDLDAGDDFGESLDTIGDLDGDGVIDLVVGTQKDDDGGSNRGAVYVLFMKTDGTVDRVQKISSTQGGFTGNLDDGDTFGIGATGLGDLDNDGVLDIAVGAARDDDGGTNRGAVYILFLNTDGTVKSHQKISHTTGGFTGSTSFIGQDLEMLGDLDNDGNEDLFVTSTSGSFWIFYLNANGTVKQNTRIFSPSSSGGYGQTGALVGDVDGDGVMDLATGAQFDDDGGSNQGAVWIIFMNANGTVKSQQKISETVGGFNGLLEPGDEFGQSVSPVGDRNRDGIPDLLVGAEHADDPSGSPTNTGELWILHLNQNGTVKSHEMIRSGSDNFTTLRKNDNLGQAVTHLGDLDGDGIDDFAASADGNRNNNGGLTGGVYIFFPEPFNPTGTGNNPPVVSNPGGQLNSEGDIVSLQIQANDPDGDMITYSALGLPTGLSINTNTGLISGTTTTEGNYTTTVTVEDTSNFIDNVTFTWTVNTSGGGSSVTYEVENLSVADSDGTTNSSIRSKDGATNGTYFLYESDAIGEFITFEIPISAAGNYDIDVKHQLSKFRGTFEVHVADSLAGPYTLIGSMNTTVTSGSSFPTLAMATSFSGSGIKYLRFTATGSNPATGNERIGLDTVEVTQTSGGGGNNPPTVTNPGDQTNTVGDVVSLQIQANDLDGDTLTYSDSGLPNGLSIDPNTGLITGTVTTANTFNTSIMADDGNGGMGNAMFTWTVNPVGGSGTTYEVESLTIADSDGTTTDQINSRPEATNGTYFLYNSDAIGEFITFELPISATGSHDIDVQYHLNRFRGTFEVHVAEALAGPYNLIGTMNNTISNTSNSFPTLAMTTSFASSGTKYLRFTVTGANPSTGREKIGLDTIVVTEN